MALTYLETELHPDVSAHPVTRVNGIEIMSSLRHSGTPSLSGKVSDLKASSCFIITMGSIHKDRGTQTHTHTHTHTHKHTNILMYINTNTLTQLTLYTYK